MLYTVLPGNYLYEHHVPYIKTRLRSSEYLNSKHFVKDVQRTLKEVYPYALHVLNNYTKSVEMDLNVIVSYGDELHPDKKYLTLFCRKHKLDPLSRNTLDESYVLLPKPVRPVTLFIYLFDYTKHCLSIIDIKNVKVN